MTQTIGINTVDQVLSRSVKRGGRLWCVTALATLVSTWALDAGATAVGVLLVASGLLDGQPQTTIIGLLVATYGIWALGLRHNLAANARLLASTGTSTNIVSKLAYGIAVRRSGSARVHRAASSVGYIASELVKEVPYYAGAMGAAMWSDSLAATDALIFLAGTNIGAGAYEFGVARLTSAFLSHRSAQTVAPGTLSLQPVHR